MSDRHITKQKAAITVYFEAIIVVNSVVFKLNACYLPIHNAFPGSSLFADHLYRNLINITVYPQAVNGS